uniref:Alpha-catulin n=1 Tax=Anopheles epiroticus TaxID=199890 RepID=A0A182P5D7_9DIPT
MIRFVPELGSRRRRGSKIVWKFVKDEARCGSNGFRKGVLQRWLFKFVERLGYGASGRSKRWSNGAGKKRAATFDRATTVRVGKVSRQNSTISTLVQHRSEQQHHTSEQKMRAIGRVGQAVNLAVERFVTVGETIADDNPEIKQDMYDACKEARAAVIRRCDRGHIET